MSLKRTSKFYLMRVVFLVLITIFISGCGAKDLTDDSEYGFVQYHVNDRGYNRSGIVNSWEGSEENEGYYKSDILYAVDAEGNLYSYDINRNDSEEPVLECDLVLENIGSLKDVHSNVAILLENGDLYIASPAVMSQEEVFAKHIIDFEEPYFQNIVSIHGTWAGTGEQCFAIDKYGMVYVWGYSEQKDFGGIFLLPTNPTPVLEDVEVFLNDDSYYNAIALTKDGDLYCWGINQNSQIGVYECISDPALRLTGVSNIRIEEGTQGVYAMRDGEEVLVNEETYEELNMSKEELAASIEEKKKSQIDKEKGFNTKNNSNLWDSRYNEFVTSLKGKYNSDGVLTDIIITYNNPLTEQSYFNDAIFNIYDQDGNLLVRVHKETYELTDPNEPITITVDSISDWNAYKFKLERILIAPNSGGSRKDF